MVTLQTKGKGDQVQVVEIHEKSVAPPNALDTSRIDLLEGQSLAASQSQINPPPCFAEAQGYFWALNRSILYLISGPSLFSNIHLLDESPP